MAAASVGQIGLDLVLNSQGFQGQLGKVTGVAKKAAGVLGGIFAVGGIVSFTKQCLELGSDLNEVQNVVDVTFGGMSSAVDAWAKDAMTNFGLSEKCAKDYVGTLGAMSKAFGFSTEQAYEQATTLAGLSADVASFYNLTGDEAYSKLKAVYTGETEGLKSLGVVMSQAALDEYALANGWGKVTAKMTEAEKVELRLAYVTNALSGASGDFARTSDGWANQTKVLALRFDALKASLGQGFINILTPALRLLNDLVARLQVAADMFRDFTVAVFGDAGGSATEQTAQAAGQFADNTASAAGAAKDYKKSLIGIDSLNKLGDNSASGSSAGTGSSVSVSTDFDSISKSADNTFDGLADKLKNTANGIKSYFTQNFGGIFKDFQKDAKSNLDKTVGIFQKAWGTVEDNLPNLTEWFNSDSGFTGLLKTTAEVGGKMFNGIWDSSNLVFGDLAENVFPTFVSTLTGSVLPAITGIAIRLEGTVGIIFDKVKRLFDSIWTDAVSPCITQITNCWGDMWSTFSEWVQGDGQSLFDGIDAIFAGIGDTLQYFWDSVLAPFYDWAVSSIAPFYEKHIKPMFENVLSWLSKAGEAIQAWWNNYLLPLFKWLTDIVGPAVQAVLKTIWTAIQNVFAIICDVVGGIFKSLGGLMDFITGVFTGDWEKAWNGIKDLFGGIWDAIWGVIKGVINAMINGINGLWSGIVGVIYGIANGIGGLVEAIGNVFGQKWGWEPANVANIPTIPLLASGGYVAANTPQLAIVGDNKREGEIIAPESKIAQAVAAGIAAAQPALGDGAVTIPITLELDGETLASTIASIQLRELMRGNGS